MVTLFFAEYKHLIGLKGSTPLSKHPDHLPGGHSMWDLGRSNEQQGRAAMRNT